LPGHVGYNSLGKDVKGAHRMKLRQVAYQAIKNAILGGRFTSEEPLIEERLASALDISRTPIREALAILEHENLIEAVPHKGLFVRNVTLNEFLQMYDAVAAVEPVLAYQAAQRARTIDIDIMKAALMDAERGIPDDAADHLAACRQFQESMGSCANNPHLTALLIGIEERLDLYLIKRWRMLPPDKMLDAVADRRNILSAIESQDPEAAAEASRAHTKAVNLRWYDMFSSYKDN
jgi:DNA-binding GntR family transcriptional regulator